MDRTTSSKSFMYAIALTILILLGGVYHFFSEMNTTYVLIKAGNKPVMKITDNYKYTQNKKGLIFSVAFLCSSLSLVIMILLPSSERESYTKSLHKPTPGTPRSDSTMGSALPADEQSIIPSMDTENNGALVNDPDILDNVEEFSEDDWPNIESDLPANDDSVVYGTGQISDVAIMDFVHKFPDSAVKFLYRKQFSGKPLSREDEDIYYKWEQRSMSRSKVKRYILSLMEWQKLPEETPHEIWKKLRDRIYDIIE